jgi:hypothetical protein
VALTAPLFLRSSPSGPYFLYGFSTLLAVIVCWKMPETKGKSLEDIAGLFEGATSKQYPESSGTSQLETPNQNISTRVVTIPP